MVGVVLMHSDVDDYFSLWVWLPAALLVFGVACQQFWRRK